MSCLVGASKCMSDEFPCQSATTVHTKNILETCTCNMLPNHNHKLEEIQTVFRMIEFIEESIECMNEVK